MQAYVIVLIVFACIFSLWGLLSLLSLLIYLIPQLVVRILNPLDLKKRYGGGWCFITGGNSGIGESFAKKVAKIGLNVVILGQNEERLNKVAADILSINQNIETKTIKADLSGNPEQVTEEIVQQLSGLDICIVYFNAGFGVFENAAQPTKKSLDQFNTNIVTHQHLFQVLYPRLVNRQLTAKKRGAILFTSSGLGIITTPGSVVYSATKSYLGHLGECLASEAHCMPNLYEIESISTLYLTNCLCDEEYAIDVVSIYPGTVNTRFSTRTSDEPPPPLLEKISQKSDTVAELALCGIGRATRIDSGFMAIIMRLVTRSIDANLFIRIMKTAAPKYEEDNKSNQQNGSESV